MQHESPIIRRKSTRIYVGDVPIGDGAPIAVQSMTNTRTTDVEATVAQIRALEKSAQTSSVFQYQRWKQQKRLS